MTFWIGFAIRSQKFQSQVNLCSLHWPVWKHNNKIHQINHFLYNYTNDNTYLEQGTVFSRFDLIYQLVCLPRHFGERCQDNQRFHPSQFPQSKMGPLTQNGSDSFHKGLAEETHLFDLINHIHQPLLLLSINSLTYTVFTRILQYCQFEERENG